MASSWAPSGGTFYAAPARGILLFTSFQKSYKFSFLKRTPWTGRAGRSPGTLLEAPRQCIQGSLCPKKPIGRPHVAKIVLKFTIF